MPIEQYTYWSVTINNPEENDYVIMRNPNSKYIRECVWTPEVGEEGTQHIQAWIRLQRNQSMAFVKKLYPRAHLKHCDKDAYNENCHQYAQKNDDTTAGNHHIVMNDPLPAADTMLYKVLEKAWDWHLQSLMKYHKDVYESMRESLLDPDWLRRCVGLKKLNTGAIEREMIIERSGLEKIFISPSYEKMKSKYWAEIIIRIDKHNIDGDRIQTQVTDGTRTEGGTSDGGSSQSDKDSSPCETEGSDQSSCSEADADDDWT